ncbi:Rhs family protein, partial [Xenorhabdus sp. PR6a]|nr:Rhs family protein [Xenorhabdus sp. PR6a]
GLAGKDCSLPEIKGTQTGFKNPHQIDSMKKDMLDGNYDFTLDKNRISVIIDNKGVYHVSDGHHRMTAAMEIHKTTGNDKYIRELLNNAKKDRQNTVPSSRPMPSRNWWGALRNKWGF